MIPLRRSGGDHVDVVIIGAGVVGLSIAWQLSRASALTIAVFDKEGPGSGTSGRSAGVICRHDQGPIYQRLSLIGHVQMRQFERDHGFTFTAWGSLTVAYGTPPRPPSESVGHDLREAPSGMYISESLTAAEVCTRFPWLEPDGISGGIFEPNIGFIDPHELIDLYRRLLSDAPLVSVDYGNPVLELRRDGDRITEIATRRGLYSATWVINASGAWANRVAALAGSSVHITPQRMNVAVGTAYDDGGPPLPLHGVPRLDWEGDGVWCRGEVGGAALFGQHRDKTDARYPEADPDHFDRRSDPEFARAIEAHVERFYRLPRSRVIDGWTCVYDTSDDGSPLIGIDARVTNLVHAVGMNGHGMTIHAGVARCVTALITAGLHHVDISDVMPWTELLDFSLLAPDRFERGAALTITGGGALADEARVEQMGLS